MSDGYKVGTCTQQEQVPKTLTDIGISRKDSAGRHADSSRAYTDAGKIGRELQLGGLSIIDKGQNTTPETR